MLGLANNLEHDCSIISIASSLFLVFYLSISNIKTGNHLFNRYTKSVISSMNLGVFFKKEILQTDQNIGKDRIVFFTTGHETLYRTAFNMFLDRPIIGHGPKMFRVKCDDPKYAEKVGTSDRGVSTCMTHPHNFYIQLLAETGLIGFSFLLLFFLYVSYCFIKQFVAIISNQKKPFTDYQICLLIAMLITLWPFSPNGNFFNNWLSILYSLPMGFYLHSIFGRNKIFKINSIS